MTLKSTFELLFHKHLAVSTSEVGPVHTDFIVGQEGRGVLSTGKRWSSAFTGQCGNAGQGRQQLSVYVNPTEKHGLMQPLIMVMEQHRCVVHG